MKIAAEILPIAIESFALLKTAKSETGNQKPATRLAADWHAALMDYGSLVCTKRNPKWDICPLTKAGLMKSAYKTPKHLKKVKKEPGRMVGSVFVPNRIFRGKIIEALRDHQRGLLAEEIGPMIAIDWNAQEHSIWLKGILKGLRHNQLLTKKQRKYLLQE